MDLIDQPMTLDLLPVIHDRLRTHIRLQKHRLIPQNRLDRISQTPQRAHTTHETLLHAIREPLDKVDQYPRHGLIRADARQRRLAQTFRIGQPAIMVCRRRNDGQDIDGRYEGRGEAGKV